MTARVFAIAALLIVTACGSGDPAPTTSAPPPEGKFVPAYQQAGEATKAEEQLLRDRKVLEDFADSMNTYVRIPRDVQVIAKDCGEANAFYEPDEHTVTLCYELQAAERKLFAEDQDVDQQVYNSAVGTLYHEAGHALIWELGLKITGREEDVADQLAAYVLTSDDEFKDILLTVADSYSLSAAQVQGLEDLPFYDTHSLDQQRAANFLCYLYGADAERFQFLVDDGELPKERADTCPDEYKQLADGWEALLAPHTR
ncbi:DUF4344 domain-containing metallopeptidase [Actinokineospora sp. HUAS TT18]|uniref:DUF4344 domain-containing metallopeptidase n=1 Tax=Actinokineospora sp. HUAS TT18 TaxID=3447451 RepID=UPI003F51CA38